MFTRSLLVVALVSSVQSNFNSIPGDWCSTRSDPCCLLRQDDCSVPIRGTRCYCDEFCDRPVNPDCCSDYLPVCHGAAPLTVAPTPPPQPDGCYHNGEYLNQYAEVVDNCNTCTCGYNGHMSCSSEPCMMDETILAALGGDGAGGNSYGYDWTATNYSMFWGRSLKDGLELKTGTNALNYEMHPIYLRYDPSSIPRSFDARVRWPGWISRPRDQGWCGASWAFSTTSMAADRFAIETAGLEVVTLSEQTLLSCDRRPQQGCGGGDVKRAWQYLWRFGVVDDDCYPYTSGVTGMKNVCAAKRSWDFNTVTCDTSKQDQVGRVGLYRTEPAYRIRSEENDIMYEIMTNGPVQAMVRVHQDFFAYRRGVYARTQLGDATVGHHSVRLIGWGEEFGAKFWLAANSGGEEWGEGGLFRIARGTNESGIEETILSVRAYLLHEYPPNAPQIVNPAFYQG